MWGQGQCGVKGSTLEAPLPLLGPSLPTVWPGSLVLTLKKPSAFLCFSFSSPGQNVFPLCTVMGLTREEQHLLPHWLGGNGKSFSQGPAMCRRGDTDIPVLPPGFQPYASPCLTQTMGSRSSIPLSQTTPPLKVKETRQRGRLCRTFQSYEVSAL